MQEYNKYYHIAFAASIVMLVGACVYKIVVENDTSMLWIMFIFGGPVIMGIGNHLSQTRNDKPTDWAEADLLLSKDARNDENE